jgi:hypothetical protein
LLQLLGILPFRLSYRLLQFWGGNTSDGCEDKFLNGVIEEEVYIEQPQGFEVHGRDSHVCRLRKALYGLKQAPRAWYSRIDGYLLSMGFTKSEVDPNLYFILVGDDPLILVLYVDDLFLTGARSSLLCANRIWLQSLR